MKGAVLMSAVSFNKESFDKAVLEEKKAVLVDFWAPWCVYCKRIGPAYEKVALEREGTLLVGKVNIDEAPEIARRYSIDTIPTIMLFVGGEPVAHVVAPESKAKIDGFISEHLV